MQLIPIDQTNEIVSPNMIQPNNAVNIKFETVFIVVTCNVTSEYAKANEYCDHMIPFDAIIRPIATICPIQMIYSMLSFEDMTDNVDRMIVGVVPSFPNNAAEAANNPDIMEYFKTVNFISYAKIESTWIFSGTSTETAFNKCTIH